jgi:23S rRNA (uracil1939-C5)-methyltransferase
MRRKNYNEIIPSLKIENAGSEGKSIARYNNKVILVDFAVPGDIADIKITQLKKSYYTGTIERLVEPSPQRIEPLCAHFGTCGGCKWQHMSYVTQLTYKQQQVLDAFQRIGKFPFPQLSPILGSEQTEYYRNKLEFTFTNRKWLTSLDTKDELSQTEHAGLGFHIPGRWDKVIDINHCYLQANPSNAVRLAVKSFAVKNGMSFFNLRSQEGLLRQLFVRNTLSGELMVIVSFAKEDEEKRIALLRHIHHQFPQITSLMYVVNNKKNDSISDLEILLFAGKDHIIEKLENLKFKIGPKSFFQTNSQQTLNLYSKTREMAQLTGNELVYDLYTGVGTIAAFVAGKAKKVIGIEYIEQAIADAKVNAILNHIENIDFFAGDMKDVLNDGFISQHGKPEVIISDPPRAGMHEEVVKKIMEIAPKRVVYVSCNPATQARDIALMQEQYQIKQVQPVDMFPHTHHVENIALLERK